MEEEGVALRLVRCPKCENVLPELPEYSVYQCGACGAVLKGKQLTPTSEKRSLENSDNENVTRVEPSTKEEVMLETSSQVKTESDEFEVGRRQGRMVHEKVPNLTPSSSSRKEKRDFFADSDKSRRRRLDFGPIRSRPGGLHRNASTVEKGRFGNLPYSNEGPSSSNLSSFNSFGDHVTHVTNNIGLNEFSKVQDLEKDRTELLKTLDELRTQLSRSCNVAESPNGRLNGPYHWPHHPPHQLSHQTPHHQYIPPTFHNPFLDYNQRDTLLHRPSCACSQCYNVNWQPLPPKVNPFSSYTSHETSYPLPEPLHYGPRHLPHHDGFGRRYPRRRVILTHGGERVSFPISGGAPFISCCNCFELLKIPKKVTFSGKNDHKTIKCAVCFALISLRLKDNKIVASFCSTVGQQKVNKRKSNRSPHSSVDYDECVYNFQLTDTEQSLSACGAEKKEESQNDVLTESLLKGQNDVLTESQRNNQERVIIDHDSKKYLKDALVASEIDVSLKDYSNGDVVSKENDRSKSKKAGNESFFAGLIKKRLRDFSRSSSGVDKVRSNVFVNGQLLTNRAVKKAEKLAGPIHPGEYWYDSVAGFWGVMNQPCLGIIPPFIEEFDHPMPKNCAAGNTSVFVNGRELNRKDLDLLAGRGLPTTKDRSYIVEISGKVVDEDTGEELDALGKLAPTVERVQHGFGMKVPKVVAT
ncbi:putative zinc-ribbon domain, plant, protein enhanced disease resistance 4 [Helianthus annuus]|nr:putative zinc-ribbon domain, plant, protein enhanced disease resistance 4 [Helianthus annuus]